MVSTSQEQRPKFSRSLFRAGDDEPVITNNYTGLKIGLSDIWLGFLRSSIWWRMARQDISMRYKRSIIGPFWISISLAAMVVGLGLLYSQIFRTEFREYLVFLATGLFAWNYVSLVINEACGVLVEGEGMVRAFPVSITGLSIRMMLRNLIILAHNAITILLVLLLFRAPITWEALNIIPGLVVFAIFPVILGAVLGPICLRFRDIAQLIANVLQILFFMTPIIWQPDQIGGRVAFVMYNPIYHLIELIRAPLLNEHIQPESWIMVLVLIGLGSLAALVTLSLTRRRVFFWI